MISDNFCKVISTPIRTGGSGCAFSACLVVSLYSFAVVVRWAWPQFSQAVAAGWAVGTTGTAAFTEGVVRVSLKF